MAKPILKSVIAATGAVVCLFGLLICGVVASALLKAYGQHEQQTSAPVFYDVSWPLAALAVLLVFGLAFILSYRHFRARQ